MSVLKIKDANNNWQDIPAIKGADGTNGVDGISPIATVSKSGNVATISITDKNGTTTTTISDGVNGTNGTNGRDGYVQYTAGDGIEIQNNTISTEYQVWIGTQEEYDELSSYDENTLYYIKEDTNAS